jgi:putative colanic acid biosysnthesis UDP-glucose lipid carrier transferase
MAKATHKYTLLRYIIDAPVVMASFFISLRLLHLHEGHFYNIALLLFALLSVIIWYVAGSFSRLYAERRSNKFSEEIVFILYSLILFGILITSSAFFLRDYLAFSGLFFVTFLSVLFVTEAVAKYIIRKLLHAAIFQGDFFENVLIVGVTPSAMELYETINRYYYYGYKCYGFIDDHAAKLNGSKYLGKLDALETILKEGNIDEVMITLPANDALQIKACLSLCDMYKTKARIVPDLQQYVDASVQVNNIGLLPVINIRALPLDKPENKILKRGFDIIFSILFFVLLGWWLLPIISLLIRLSSRGPAIFKQERWGINNEKITCYKFRTMVSSSNDIDEEGNYNQATKNDPRITAIGAFMRKTNMDELPQFWNVLMGDMSVVGPRPHPTPLNMASMHTIDNYMLRHIVTPGITGWAQVNGCRGETKAPGSMQKRVNFDLYYIHRWTFWLDCQIILQTIINLMRGDQNAY